MPCALPQLNDLKLIPHLKMVEICKIVYILHALMDLLPSLCWASSRVICVGLLAIVVFQIKDTEKDHKLFLQ